MKPLRAAGGVGSTCRRRPCQASACPAEVTLVVIQPDHVLNDRVAVGDGGRDDDPRRRCWAAEELDATWGRLRAEFLRPRKNDCAEAVPGRHVDRRQPYGRPSRNTCARPARAREALDRREPAHGVFRPLSVSGERRSYSQASGRTLRYGEVAEAAAKMPPPSEPTKHR